MASIVVKGLGRRIGKKTIFEDIDFNIPSGAVPNIEGPSGSGKSMLLRGRKRSVEPTSGYTRVGGRSILKINPIDLRRTVGMVFQEPVRFGGNV